MPDSLNYIAPTGAVNRNAIKASAENFDFPLIAHADGFLSSAPSLDFDDQFTGVVGFSVKESISCAAFVPDGWLALDIQSREASDMMVNLCGKPGRSTANVRASLRANMQTVWRRLRKAKK